MTSNRWLAVLALLSWLAAISAPALSQPAGPREAATWQVYGTSTRFERDAIVPGGSGVQVGPRATPGEPWSSGAGMLLPQPLKAGERVTAAFWARSARPESVHVTIQGGAPAYSRFAADRVDLTPHWQLHAIGGVAPADLAAGSQSLTVQLGRVRSAVSLGPVDFLPGTPDPAGIRRAFAGFQPTRIAEDVTIPSDPGVALAATLRLPARSREKPSPVVILLPGHGPWPRGGFPLLVERLTAAGIGTFDYDKRGIGQSTGSFLDTMEVMERDAAAAAAYLRERPDVDDTRIAVLGLSQGGVIAPAIAARDPSIAAVVMLAGPAGERGLLFLDGMRARLALSGTRADAIEPILEATAPFMTAQAAGAPPGTIASLREALHAAFVAGGHAQDAVAGFLATLGNPVVVSQYKVAPNEALRRIKSPVLAVYAGEDDVVLTSQSLPQADAALRDNADATVIVVPRVNHTFQRRQADAGGGAVFSGPSVSDPATLDLVSAWLESRMGRAPR